MTDHFFDGVREEANRTNGAAGRSWHIPEDREPSRFIIGVAVVAVLIVGLSLIASVS